MKHNLKTLPKNPVGAATRGDIATGFADRSYSQVLLGSFR